MRALPGQGAGRGDRLYQQNHCGMYRSDDGGETGISVEEGLPSTFGFPAAAHPRDPEALFLFPLNGAEQGRFAPDGKPTVWKTTDGGAHWRGRSAGLPQGDAFFGVLRQAMATDALEPAGVYFGAGNGAVYASADEGETWTADRRESAGDLVGRNAGDRRVTISRDDHGPALVRLPASLTALFPGAPRASSNCRLEA